MPRRFHGREHPNPLDDQPEDQRDITQTGYPVSLQLQKEFASALADARETTDALREYGLLVGLAFQLADDVLDADEDAGEDGPPSYCKLLGVEQTRIRSRELAEQACALVGSLPDPSLLEALAWFSVERDH